MQCDIDQSEVSHSAVTPLLVTELSVSLHTSQQTPSAFHQAEQLPKIALPVADFDPPLIHGTWAHRIQNGIFIGSADFAQLIRVPNTQTGRQTDTHTTPCAAFVAIGRIYVTHAMWPKNAEISGLMAWWSNRSGAELAIKRSQITEEVSSTVRNCTASSIPSKRRWAVCPFVAGLRAQFSEQLYLDLHLCRCLHSGVLSSFSTRTQNALQIVCWTSRASGQPGHQSRGQWSVQFTTVNGVVQCEMICRSKDDRRRCSRLVAEYKVSRDLRPLSHCSLVACPNWQWPVRRGTPRRRRRPPRIRSSCLQQLQAGSVTVCSAVWLQYHLFNVVKNDN